MTTKRKGFYRNLKIQTKLAFPIIVVAFMAFLVIFGFLLTKVWKTTQREAFDKAREQASRYSSACQAWLEVAMDASRTLAETFEGMKLSGNPMDRTMMDAILKQVLEKNRDFLGVWTCWEPDALDGNDATYANKPGHDATGRYIPYWHRGGGSIAVEPLAGYDVPGEGDYYLLARNSGDETILNPYEYEIGGSKVLLTSVVVPIRINGRTIGVAGIDLTMDFLSSLIADIRPYETGYGFMVANNGTFVAHPKHDIIGKSLADVGSPQRFIDTVNVGGTISEVRTSLETGNESYMIFVPLTIGKTKTPWSFAVSIPMDKVMAQAREMLWFGIIGAIIALLAIGIVVLLVARSISKTLKQLAGGAQAIADGHLDVNIHHDSNDELGMLATSLNAMAQKFFIYVSSLDAVPFPVSVTDMDMNWLFFNKATEAVTGLKRADMTGKPCNNWNADICKTEHCGIECLRRGKKTSTFLQPGMDADFQVDTAFLQNVAGEQIGHIELVQDISSASRIAKYNEQEVARLAENLNKMAQGDLTINTEQTRADKYCTAQFDQFKMINDSLMAVAASVEALISDANTLAIAGVEGSLATRADENKHQGAYKDVVRGVNNLLDAVATPFRVSIQFLDDMAHGRAPKEIKGEYKGDYVQIKDNINACVDILTDVQKEVIRLSQAGSDGELDVRADSSRFPGTWKYIVDGYNTVINAITEPLNEAATVLKEASNNDLTQSINGDYKGQFADFKNNINQMLRNLDETLAQVASSVTQMNAGANQISDASQSLSQGATEQASSLEEISSSMQQIASQTKGNAENATQANAIANKARESAEEGGEKMNEMVSAMTDINASSMQIAKIIKVIDDIAFQTNLLALNAAVEAARAGVHGKGFAVVADEVRNLAGRSAKAAKETADLIDLSGSKVSNGLKVAQSTSESFQGIIEEIVKAADLVGEIAAASNEQAQGVAQITIGLNQVDQVTQQNTASAEETASAAEELRGQSQELQDRVSLFTLSGITKTKAIPAEAPKKKQQKKAPPALARKSEGWGDAPKKGTAHKNDVIMLDDEEFGRF